MSRRCMSRVVSGRTIVHADVRDWCIVMWHELYHVVPHWADGLVTRDGILPRLLIHIDVKSTQNRFYADG